MKMMWFNYSPTSGVTIHYTNLKGEVEEYNLPFSRPQEVVSAVAMLISNNEITDVTCAGIAYSLADAIKQQLVSIYHKNNVNFVKGE